MKKVDFKSTYKKTSAPLYDVPFERMYYYAKLNLELTKKEMKKYYSFIDKYMTKHAGAEWGEAHSQARPIRQLINCYIASCKSYCAFALEGCINHVSVMVSGSKYTQKYIDKLGPIEKWVLVPRIVLGMELDTSDNRFKILKKIFKFRNELVHPKTKQYATQKDIVDFIDSRLTSYEERLQECQTFFETMTFYFNEVSDYLPLTTIPKKTNQ